tara:strand:+ start:841 stop:1365 length:525 start_codon:yes stop_codon:yes gene_type:complete
MYIVKVISTRISEARRLIKFLRRGRSDVKENFEASPFGLDSNPVENTVALYSDTSVNGQSVVIGYVGTNKIADVGEFRTFATDSNGNEVFYTYLKNDGTMELGGDADNLARYGQIEASVNELKDSVAELKNIFSAWTPVPQDGGTALQLSALSWSTTPLVEDITLAKIDEIKTL